MRFWAIPSRYPTHYTTSDYHTDGNIRCVEQLFVMFYVNNKLLIGLSLIKEHKQYIVYIVISYVAIRWRQCFINVTVHYFVLMSIKYEYNVSPKTE